MPDNCHLMTLSPISPELWAACCPGRTTYGGGASTTWEADGSRYPCTEAQFAELLESARAPSGWSNRELFVFLVLSVTILFLLAGCVYAIRKRWGRCMRIRYDHAATLAQVRLFEWRTLRAATRAQQAAASAGIPRSPASNDLEAAAHLADGSASTGPVTASAPARSLDSDPSTSTSGSYTPSSPLPAPPLTSKLAQDLRSEITSHKFKYFSDGSASHASSVCYS